MWRKKRCVLGGCLGNEGGEVLEALFRDGVSLTSRSFGSRLFVPVVNGVAVCSGVVQGERRSVWWNSN